MAKHQPRRNHMAALRITDDCIGCESCVDICPDAFEMDEEANVAVVKNPDSKAPCIDEAMDACPVDAIVRD